MRQANHIMPFGYKIKKLIILLLFLLFTLLLVGCGGTSEATTVPTDEPSKVTHESPSAPDASKVIEIVATTTVIADFLRHVGGDKVDVTVMIKEGSNHHTFEPTMSEARLIAEADIIFSNGIGLEQPWLNDLRESTNSTAVLEVVSWGAYLLDLDHRDHIHQGGDPYIWHNTENAKIMVDNIALGLAEFDPAHQEQYEANAEAYKAELEALTEEIASLLNTIPPERRKLVTGHEAFAYFADQFEFELIGTVIIASHESKQSSTRDIEKLIQKIKEEQVPAIFAGISLNPRQAQTIADEASVPLIANLYSDSLGEAGSEGETYLSMMRYNAQTIYNGLQEQHVNEANEALN